MTTGRINQIARVVRFSPPSRERGKGRAGLCFSFARSRDRAHASFLLRRQGPRAPSERTGHGTRRHGRSPPARSLRGQALQDRRGVVTESQTRPTRFPDSDSVPGHGSACRATHPQGFAHDGRALKCLRKGRAATSTGKTTHQRRAEVFPGLPSSQPRRPHRGLN